MRSGTQRTRTVRVAPTTRAPLERTVGTVTVSTRFRALAPGLIVSLNLRLRRTVRLIVRLDLPLRYVNLTRAACPRIGGSAANLTTTRPVLAARVADAVM